MGVSVEAELGLDGNAHGMSQRNDGLGLLDVLLIGKGGGVDHDVGEAGLNGADLVL